MKHPGRVDYGYMALGIFYRKIVALTDDGFVFKGKAYSWRDIDSIEAWDDSVGVLFTMSRLHRPFPRAQVVLSDGKKFVLKGDELIKSGWPLEKGCSSAFDELVSFLKAMHRNGNRQSS